MFERLTTPRRAVGHRKSALALAVLINVSGVGSMLTFGDVQRIIEEAEDAPLIEVMLAPAPAPAAPLAAAFAPPSAPKESIKPPKEPVVEEPPVEPDEPVEVTDPVVPAEASPPAHTGDPLAAVDGPPSAGGCPPGMVCEGPPESAGTGCPAGQVCNGEVATILSVTAADVRPKRRVRPSYPDAAKALNISEARCLVRFSVDAKGSPTDVQVSGCPRVFHDAVLKAAWQWKFYPVRNSDGVKSAASFTLALTFRLH